MVGHGWGPSMVQEAFALSWLCPMSLLREGKGEVGAGQLFKMNSVRCPHINATASPFPPSVFWHFSLGYTELLLCFSAPPSPQGPISLPAFLAHWWQRLHAAPCPPAPLSRAPSLRLTHSLWGPPLLLCPKRCSSPPPLCPQHSPFPPSPIQGCPRPSPPADTCRFLHGSYLHPSVGAEVLQGPKRPEPGWEGRLRWSYHLSFFEP